MIHIGTHGAAQTEDPTLSDRYRTYLRLLLTLVAATLGGVLFNWLTLPLPWMLGPIVVSTIAAVLRLPVQPPTRARPYVVVIIGVLLGSGFSPAMLGQLSNWAISLSLLAVYLSISGLLVVPYYRWVGGLDPVTAYFAGMPGGLNEMMMIGKEMGGDDRIIILSHASRIVVVVCLLALWFRVILGVDLSDRSQFGVAFVDVPLSDLTILLICGIAGYLAGPKLRLPAPFLVGPMLFSAVVHATGYASNPPPREVVIAAQILLGTIMGCRFLGSAPRAIGRALLLGVGATVIMLSVSGAFALLLHQLFGQALDQVLLAYAPGGLAEMSLVALALNADVAYVATHHLVRITFVIVAAPAVFGLMRRFWRRPDSP
ncbi:AbrB family transcriptional regulator [Puniceibacterium sp. IMCC21224]|uniref:AbrB family transcriptional regulator n=1 Tax=Puniceibacterium sp. IMCC21224 TaxID=1618204 RepID=UPI00065D0737|nr:AbrB family transcriptional regulator [Puniceibacterium sp. IMCC21224]KMK66567.1 membrane protein AbrB duplication [Puniceibacterium sp. IMCC21224]